MATNLTFSGSSELDWGQKVAYEVAHDDQAAWSSANMSLTTNHVGTFKVALGGGGGGIGSAVCRAFAKEGVGVAIADMDGARAGELANEIATTGGNAIFRAYSHTCQGGKPIALAVRT